MSGLWTPSDGSGKNADIDRALRELGEAEGHETGAEGPQLRLLRCTICRSLEELPDYAGDPHYDVVLDGLVYEHNRRHPNRDDSGAFLMRVSQKMWDDPRKKKAIHKQIWSDMEGTGFIPEYYATKSTYHEDARKCFIEHRKSVPCIDWHNDRKRIGNPTKEGWREGRIKVYLCDFCPVASKVMEAKNKAAGLYDN